MVNAKLLRVYRLVKNLSQEDLASKFGISQGLLSLIENNKKVVGSKLEARIREHIDLDKHQETLMEIEALIDKLSVS